MQPKDLVERFNLAALCILLAASSLSAQVQLNRDSKNVLEIRGGSGAQSWILRYGSNDTLASKAQFVVAAGNRAWFSHGGWLRLIDTENGVVVGRWRFPGMITRLTPMDAKVDVDIEDGANPTHWKVTLDPAASRNDFGISESLLTLSASRSENSVWKVGNTELGSPEKIQASEKAKDVLPELETAIRRDPTSPWIQVLYARLLRIMGDDRAGKAFDQSIQLPTTDFSELLPISAFLDRIGEREAARSAYERGYKNFLESGNDPRLLVVLLNKLMLYQPWGREKPDLSDPYNRELVERNYRIAPRAEAADLAWTSYAEYLEKNGRPDEARTWRDRARDAEATSAFLLSRQVLLWTDFLITITFASLFAGVAYLAYIWLSYLRQRRADSKAYQDKNLLIRILSWFNFQYWSRGQRVAFLTIVLVAWVSTGCTIAELAAILRAAAAPISIGSGNVGGPVAVRYLENFQPPTRERDLLVAFAYQQSGDVQKAERMYRSVPDYAESWNNLGVLQKIAGKEQEARQSFEHALQLDPNLNEASLNLGQAPHDLWTELHQKYVPGRPMLAPPRGERLSTLFFGGSSRAVMLSAAVAGPIASFRSSAGIFSFAALSGDGTVRLDPVSEFIDIAIIAALVLALILVFLRPKPAERKSGRILAAIEIFFPGVSPAWSFLGGLVLTAYLYFAILDLIVFGFSGSNSFTSFSIPSSERAYGTPTAENLTAVLLHPNTTWLVLAPTLLLAINAVLVVHSRLHSGKI